MNRTTRIGVALVALLFATSYALQGDKVSLKIVHVDKHQVLELNGERLEVPALSDVSALTKRFAQIRGTKTVIEITVPDGTSLEPVFAAVQAAKDAGYTQIRYWGCIPPGCSILTGATPDQQRFKGRSFKAADLMKIVIENSYKC